MVGRTEMHTLAELYKLYIFEMLPREVRTQEKAKWWKNVQRGKQIPYAFARGFQITTDVAMLSILLMIGVTTHAPGITIVGMELLLIITYTLLLLARIVRQFLLAFGAYLLVIGLGSILNLLFPGMWGGSIVFYILCTTMIYRFPPEWSLPLASICILTLITTDGALGLLLLRQPEMLALNLAVAGGLCWFGWTRRSQYLLVVRLHETQEQLRAQMIHSEELATERERTRIARDIHDVLSHSLAVLSIQVQAARHLVTRDPERLMGKLDDMALLIRESITESRHVVGLLREKPATPFGEDNLGASLRSIANTFNERTGIRCLIEENGTPHKVGQQQRETLQLALREMLTNAHRHGAAQAVWIKWRWREASIILEVHDDGKSTNLEPTDALADVRDNEAHGHHGLQGIRERVTVLNGSVEAGQTEDGGFIVTLRLPFENLSDIAAQKR
jgi:signal transduction histidine kinase